jgi:hypothetical protein
MPTQALQGIISKSTPLGQSYHRYCTQLSGEQGLPADHYQLLLVQLVEIAKRQTILASVAHWASDMTCLRQCDAIIHVMNAWVSVEKEALEVQLLVGDEVESVQLSFDALDTLLKYLDPLQRCLNDNIAFRTNCDDSKVLLSNMMHSSMGGM